jgi:LysM repeat protein
MQWPKGQLAHRGIWPAMLAIFVVSHASAAFASSLLYKNYIIRYDRGWDILCEPYVVKKNDWVLKIFRQKGEIAHQDFREFSSIFKRLNPHIKNIDMIRPGQGIDIPLRKLEHGALPGQDAGVVTIPFVALKKVTEVVKKHSDRYVVQRGDTVSKLIARKYGRYSTKAYKEGVKLLKAANPTLTNLDRIYAGQTLYLPDPIIREKSWYASMYDTKGNLRDTMNQAKGQSSEMLKEKPASVPMPKAIPKPKAEKTKGNLTQAAALVGGQLQNKGTYFLPRAGDEDFELDLSKHPTLELGEGPKLVFTLGNKIMDMDSNVFHSKWPDMKPVSIDSQASTEQYVSAIFEAMEDEGQPSEEVVFEKQGVRVAVRAKWVRIESEGRHLCITPIADPDQQTPDAIRRYLEQNGIIIKEILPGGTAMGLDQGGIQRHNIKNILAIAPSSQKDFVKTLAKILVFTYVSNTIITFPYAGIQVQAYANLLSTKNGQEILVDFSDLYGDAINSIDETGLKVVRIFPDEDYDTITQKLFSALAIQYEQSPTLLAVQRTGEYNTAITINGFLYSNDDSKQTLLTSADLPSAITDMLSDRDIDVVLW